MAEKPLKCDIKKLYTDERYANYPLGDTCLKKGNCPPDPCLSEGLFDPLPPDLFVPVEGSTPTDVKLTFYSVADNGYNFNGKKMALDADRYNTNDPQWCALAPQRHDLATFKDDEYLGIITPEGKISICKPNDKTDDRFFGKKDKKGRNDERADATKAGFFNASANGIHGFNYPMQVQMQRFKLKDNESPKITLTIHFADSANFRTKNNPVLGKDVTKSKYWPMFERYWELARFRKDYNTKHPGSEPVGIAKIVLADRQVPVPGGSPMSEMRLLITDIHPDQLGFYLQMVQEYVKKKHPNATFDTYIEDKKRSAYIIARDDDTILDCNGSGCKINFEPYEKFYEQCKKGVKDFVKDADRVLKKSSRSLERGVKLFLKKAMENARKNEADNEPPKTNMRSKRNNKRKPARSKQIAKKR